MSDLSRQWATLDPAKRRLVEAALRKKGVDPARLPIEARPHDAPAPLSLAQERLWLLARMAPGSTVYNETYRAQFDAAHLDVEALGRAWRQLAARQRLLRARFVVGADGDGVLTTDGAEPPWRVIDLAAEADAAGAFEALLANVGAQVFDLEHGPVARAILARLGDGRWGFVLALHHIICDGRSILLIANELSALYGAEIGGQASADPPVLPDLPIHYADYAHWQRRLLLPMLAGAPLDGWRERLAGAPTVLTLPTDRPRPPVQSYRGDTVAAILPLSLDARMAAFAREHSATPFMVLLAAFGALLGRYTGQHDLLIGSPVDTRDRDELRSLVGFFVNTVALRLDLAGNPTAEILVAGVRATVLDAFEHRAVPFAKVVERMEPERSPGHAPLVQVLFIVQPSPAEVTESEGLALGLRPVDNGTSKFDLTAVLRRRDDGLEMRLQYASDLFERATMTRFMDHYRTLLEGMLDRPGATIIDLPILTRPEREALQQWNASRDDRIPSDCTWTELFQVQAAATPGAIAVESDTETLSYRALAVRANQLGHRLRQLGVGPEVPVGVALEHGVDMVVALLGIFSAGGAYVPLDPSYPEDRLRVMVSAADLGLIVADAAARAVLRGGSAARTLVLTGGALDDGTGPRSFVDHGHEQPPTLAHDPDGLAYLIFTSGSTGIPKAVMVSHRSLVNLALNFVETFKLGLGERLLMMLSLSFDASVGDVFPPLVAGATVVLHPQPSALGGSPLWRTLESGRISVIELSAVFWQQWVDELARRGRRVPRALRTVVTGGDSADVERVRTWFSLADHPTRLLNNYGPTEATVCSAYLPVDPARLATLTTPRLPIGGPMSNIELHVLDYRGQPLPALVPGELAIGGRGVTRGYFGQPAATARAFVPNPFSARPGSRLYCTGDLVRRLADGNLEFLGRIDHQAKIRGFRIEPGEIEVALIGHPAVREVAVKAVGARAEDRRLVAYLVAEHDTEAPDLAALRSYLADRLPAHMVPSAAVALDALPMTATGKVDRKALPEPGDARTERARFAPPRDRAETVIADAWCTVLEREQIGIFDNVFDLGAHSLLVLKVQGLLEDAFGREIPTLDFFRFPTIDALARGLAGEGAPATEEQGHKTPVRRDQTVTEIAIVGMAGRFPEAPDVDTFWRNLCAGVEAITTFGDDELEAVGYCTEALAQAGMVKAKGVLASRNGVDPATEPTNGYGVEYFDAAHFGFHPREAELLDPQHRHFLEVSWEALERAGHDPARFPGLIGVFAGCGRNAYLFNNLWGRPNLLLESGIAQTMIGNDKDFLPTRVSYKLGLRGPSFAVQSACSTSLVAAHVACRALLDGECDLALVGGVTIPVPQTSAQVVEAGGIFSPDGHCRAFAADAAGTVPGSGVGVVVLRRLDDALADGDRIHAVVLGTAVSNDGGHKVGYTAPAIEGQARAIRQALARAEIKPATVGFVETHGTGTALGDAIEVEALQQAYDTRGRTNPLRLGAVKSNIGHLDTAAGVAGLIKTALVLENGHIPPSLHCAVPNPALRLDDKGLTLVPEGVDWQPDGGPRRAGLSSFGLGGTNAHVILEQPGARSPSGPGRRAELLVLSARVRSALDRATTRLADHLQANPETSLADVAYTLQLGRREMAHRRIVVATSGADAVDALRGAAPGRLRSAVHDGHPRPVVFLFPGQGAQYPGMARRLYADESEVRRWIDRAADALVPLLDGDLRTVLGVIAPANDQAPGDLAACLTETRWTQPALFAVEHAIGRLLLSWGVRPAALLGHSIGEWTAACLAGTVDFDDAMRLVAARGRAMQAAAPGAMLGVSLDAKSLGARLAGSTANATGNVELAAINGPQLCSVAGPTAAIDAFAAELATDGIEHRRLHVSHAFHSAMMDDAAADFAAVFSASESPVTLRPPAIPWVSNVTGTWITEAQATDPAYWAHQLRATVRFADGLATVETASDGTPPVLLEVGPGNSLTTLARRALERPDVATTLPHPSRGGDDLVHLLEGLGELWLAGAKIDWRAFHGDQMRYRVPVAHLSLRASAILDRVGAADPRHGRRPVSRCRVPAQDHGPDATDGAPSVATTVDPQAPVTQVPSGRHPRPALRNDYQAPASDLEQGVGRPVAGGVRDRTGRPARTISLSSGAIR